MNNRPPIKRGVHQARMSAGPRKSDPRIVSEAMYSQDVAPFREGFDVLAQELARALPRWTDTIGAGNPAKRAGVFLRTMRNAAGLSQAKLGETAGMKQSDISALETGDGKQGPTFDVMARIADACGFAITFAAKTPEAKAAAMRAPEASERVVRTYVMGDDGELTEFEGTSPSLGKGSTVIVDDSAGRTFKVSIEAPRAKIAIAEAEEEVAAAVQQAQSAEA
jgi:transcriptional regulator with XRE-family HTH domain